MSQAVLNNSQATGHTDLLSGILKVQVRNEEKITEQDRIYCQNQQDELYKTLDQIAWWYNIFKREAEKYEGKIKLKHEPNGKITTSSYDLHYRYNNDEKDYTHHEFTPFKNINELVDSSHSAIRNFISRIIGYFNNTYSVSVEAPKIDEKTLPIDFQPVYNTYVDVVGKAIKRIKELDLSMKPSLDFARDMFLFSFYTRGMSFIDMAYLKKKDLQNGILAYRRRKTGQQLFIRWEKCMQEIIDKYPDCHTDYLLPVIKRHEEGQSQYRNALRLINNKLKEIAVLAGLQTNLTMYVSRHSWASIAQSKNIPLSVISEGMGHDSEATTQIYLASLDSAMIDKANRAILKGL